MSFCNVLTSNSNIHFVAMISFLFCGVLLLFCCCFGVIRCQNEIHFFLSFVWKICVWVNFTVLHVQLSICITFGKQLGTTCIDDPNGWVDCYTIVSNSYDEWWNVYAWLWMKILVVIAILIILSNTITTSRIKRIMIIVCFYWKKIMLSTRIECKNASNWSNSTFLVSLESRESELEIHGKMDNFGQIHGNLQSNLDEIYSAGQERWIFQFKQIKRMLQ